MNFDLLGSKPKAAGRRTAEIKEWVLEVFRLPADVAVMVTELRCQEPGCPPLETVVAILDTPGQPRQFAIHKALAEVTFADLLQLAQANRPPCDKE
jgi:hypothetical protein